MKRVLSFIRRLEDIGAVLAALALFLMFALGLVEILMREVLHKSLAVSLEYTGYLVAFAFLMGTGWTFRENRHIRLTLFSPKGRLGLHLERLVLALALVLSGLLGTGLVLWTLGSYELGSVSFFPSATPLWIPQALLSLGPVVLFFSVLGRFLETFVGPDR